MHGLKNRQELMDDLARKIAAAENPVETLFQERRELLGFNIQWLKPEIQKTYAQTHGIDADDTEIVLIQVNGKTDCHLHEQGMGVFRTLGPAEGFADPAGSGILVKTFKPGVAEYELERVEFRPGDFTVVPPYEIHALYAVPGVEMGILGVVNPRIKDRDNAESFDVLEFDYIGEAKVRAAFPL